MISIVAFSLLNVLISLGNIRTDGWRTMLIGMVQFIPPFVLVPRFILGLRQLYARDLQGRHANDIDTALGLTWASGLNAVASTIMFADAGQNECEREGEEIQMEDREENA